MDGFKAPNFNDRKWHSILQYNAICDRRNSAAFNPVHRPTFQFIWVYIFWTCRDKQEAKRIIHELLGQRLIACASIFPEVESIYRWEGKIEESQEVKVILKTVPKHFDMVQSYIQKHCSYEVPEISQVDINQGNFRYLSWIAEECNLNH